MFPPTSFRIDRAFCFPILFAVLFLGCTSWHTQSVTPQEVLATQHPQRIRATLAHHRQVILNQPSIRGDTLYGRVGEQKDDKQAHIALAEVEQVAISKPDEGKTVMAVLGGAAAAFGVYFVALLITHPWD